MNGLSIRDKSVFSLELSLLVLAEKGAEDTGGKTQCPTALEQP